MDDATKVSTINHPLFFIREVKISNRPDKCFTNKPMLLTPTRIRESELEEWSGWAIGRETKPVHFSFQIAESLVLSPQGDFSLPDRDFLDGQPYDILQAMENAGAFLEIVPSIIDLPVPFWITTEQDIACCTHTVSLELLVHTLDQSPDLKAHLCYYQEHPCPMVTTGGIVQFRENAQTIQYRKGHYLPACLDLHGEIVSCVLHLRKPLGFLGFGKPHQFLATIHLSKNLAELQPGTVFYREVKWTHEGREMSAHAEIARII